MVTLYIFAFKFSPMPPIQNLFTKVITVIKFCMGEDGHLFIILFYNEWVNPIGSSKGSHHIEFNVGVVMALRKIWILQVLPAFPTFSDLRFFWCFELSELFQLFVDWIGRHRRVACTPLVWYICTPLVWYICTTFIKWKCSLNIKKCNLCDCISLYT